MHFLTSENILALHCTIQNKFMTGDSVGVSVSLKLLFHFMNFCCVIPEKDVSLMQTYTPESFESIFIFTCEQRKKCEILF